MRQTFLILSVLLVSLFTLGYQSSVVLAQTSAADELLAPEPKAAPAADANAGQNAPADPAAAAGPPPAAPANAKGDDSAAAAAAAEASGEAPAEAAEDAEGEEEVADEGESWISKMLNQGAIGYIRAGGFFMLPLLALGIIAGGVIIERYRSLQMLRTDTAALRAEVHELLQEDRVEEAFRLCDSQQGPVPAILATGLRQFLVLKRLGYDPGKIEESVVKSMDDYSVHIVAALERHLPILATISSVAPMLGFLGTVQGMIVAFDTIVRTMGETNIVAAAAEGIKVSLLTTLLGLIVGIPAFMAFNYFTSVINSFVLQVEESATELIEVVTLQMTMNEQAKDGSNAAEAERVGAFDE